MKASTGRVLRVAGAVVATLGLTTLAPAAVAGQTAPITSARSWCDTPTTAPVAKRARPAVRACWDAQEVAKGHVATVRGRVSAARGNVSLERLSGSSWNRVATAAVNSGARFVVSFSTTTAGQARYRVVWEPGAGQRTSVISLPSLRVVQVITYSVTTRGRITADVGHFTAFASDTYGDARGWGRTNRRFVQVPSGGHFTLVLSEARHLPSFSPVCSVEYSCRAGRFVVINQDRWRLGSRHYPGSLTSYRQMVINHETGHWLGRGHVNCTGSGPAPVMQQQSKGMQGCRPNPWPLDWEIRGSTVSSGHAQI